MSTSIGAVNLDYDMVWTDEFDWNPRYTTVTPTCAGGVYVQEFPRSERGARNITLETANGQGFQKKATVQSLKTLEQTGGTVALTISHNSETLTRTVRFRSEVDGGAVQFSMPAPMDGLQVGTHLYSGKIYLQVAA